MQANNISWHVFHARHFCNVKLVKIIYTNLLKASLNKPSSLCQGCTVKQDTSVNPALLGKSLKCDINDICYMM